MPIKKSYGVLAICALVGWFLQVQSTRSQVSISQFRPTPVCNAIVAGDFRRAIQLVEQGADVNASYGCALIAAASRAQLQLVELLLDRGANPNRTVTEDLTVVMGGTTPLVAAVQSRDPQVVQLLLKRGANPREDYEAFNTALGIGHIRIAELLLEHGADPNMQPPAREPVYSYEGNRQIVVPSSDLVPDRIDETAKRLQCRFSAAASLLHVAAGPGSPEGQDGRVQIAKLLIEKGANVNARALDGSTPLMVAASQQNHIVLAILLKTGADVSATDRCGKTAIDYADLYPRHSRARLTPQTKELLRGR